MCYTDEGMTGPPRVEGYESGERLTPGETEAELIL